MEESTHENSHDKPQQDGEATFGQIKKKVEDKIDSFINKKFKEQAYDARQAQKWANGASEEIIKQIQDEVGSDFKFMCTLIVLQKGDTGFHMSASCFWESKSDGNFNKKYEF